MTLSENQNVIKEVVNRLANFYGEAMLEAGLSEGEIARVHLGVLRRELDRTFSKIR